MANKKYEIEYLPTFISQFNNILYYITYELKNKIAIVKDNKNRNKLFIN